MKELCEKQQIDVVNIQDSFGQTALFHAVVSARYDIFEYLIKQRHADV